MGSASFRGRSRFVSVLLGCVLLASFAPAPSSAGQGSQGLRILRIRAGSWGDRFRVVIDLTGRPRYRYRVLENPHRIAIALEHVRAEGVDPPPVEDWMVRRIRINRLRADRSQVVLDLATAPSFKVFFLPREGSRPDRVVCDVFREADHAGEGGEHRWVVVVDPGHGGRDPGAVNRRLGLKEKDIVLDVAWRLKRYLDTVEGITCRLTRESDLQVGLIERIRRAEAMGADVFVSIHVNNCKVRSAKGAEVFFLSLKGATSAADRELEKLENAAPSANGMLLPDATELPFAVDLLQADTIRRSSLLAETILSYLGDSGLAATRGVKQANFVVLRSCRVPSVLIELGFFSNPTDAKRLMTPAHRQALAETIGRGLVEFKRRYARRGS